MQLFDSLFMIRYYMVQNSNLNLMKSLY